MRISKDLLLRQIAGEHILVPVGSAALKIQGMLCLSQSAAFLLGKLQSGCSEAELTDALLSEYDVDPGTAAADVHDFVAQLQSVGALA